MEIRNIEESELKELKKLSNYGFSKWKDEIEEDEKLDFFKNADNIGVFDEDELVSALVIHHFDQIVRKDIKKMGGIGGVATYPEYRNKGLISSLMKESFKKMKDNDQSVSMLFPFKESFYEKYQYVSTNNNMKLKVPIESFEHYRNYEAEGDWKVIRKDSEHSQEDFLKLTKKAALQRYHGTVLLDTKSEDIWHIYSKDQIFVFIKRDDKIVAGAKYTKKGYMKMNTPGELNVSNMYWTDLDSRNMLFKFFSKHIDQVETIKMFIPYGTNFYSWLKNNRKVEADFMPFPWMVRIIDVEDALNNITIDQEGSMTIKVKDKSCDWNNNNYLLESKNGKLRVKETDEGEEVTLSIDALSSFLYGAYSFKETEKLYSITYHDESKRKLLKRWFPQELIFNPNFF